MSAEDPYEHKVCKTYLPISVKISILYPLNIPENGRLSSVFKEYQMGEGFQEWAK